MMKIYLDNNATTRLDPLVKEAMDVDLGEIPMNPSSMHAFGREGRYLLTEARKTIAKAIGTLPSEIVFTSGATEALTTLIAGIPAKKVLTSNIEHPAVTGALAAKDAEVVELPGVVTPEMLENCDGDLLVLSAANSETGSLLDLEKIAAWAERKKIPFIVDGVQLLGKVPFTLFPGITAAAFSGHKIHGPKGVGFFFLRSGTKCAPLLRGGHQERGVRGGTENLSGILGLAKAIEIATPLCSDLRDHFESLLSDISEINGEHPRLPNTSNLYFPGIDGETLLIHLDLNGIYASHGSACTSGALEPSRVLLSLGYSPERAKSSLRFSLSRFTTKKEITRAAKIIRELVVSNRTDADALATE